MRNVVALLLGALLGLSSCEKNTVSKVPNISLIGFGPSTTLRVNVDSPVIAFNFTDGDADLATGNTSAVYLKDSRFDTGYLRYDFPSIDASILNPKNGVNGQGYLYPNAPVPRFDSVHIVNGDTLVYEMYITDNAGNKSNHIVTPQIIVK